MLKRTNSNSFFLNAAKKAGLTESEYSLNITTLFITSIYAFYEKKDLKSYSSELDALYKKIVSLRNNFSSNAKSNQNLFINKALYSKIFDEINDAEPILLSRNDRQKIIRALYAYAKPNYSFHKILICCCFSVSIGLLYLLFHYGPESSLFSYLCGGCIGFFLCGIWGLLTFTNLFYKYRFITRLFPVYFRFTAFNLSELIHEANNQFDKIDYKELTYNPVLAITETLKNSIDSILAVITENPNSSEIINTEITKFKEDLFNKIDSAKENISSTLSDKIDSSKDEISDDFFLAMGDISNPEGFLNKKALLILRNAEHPIEEKEFIYIFNNHKFWKSLVSLCKKISEDSNLCMNSEQFTFVFFNMHEHFFKKQTPEGNNHTYQILFRILKEGKFVTGEESTVKNKLVLYKKNELTFPWPDGTKERDKPEDVEAGIKMRKILNEMKIIHFT